MKKPDVIPFILNCLACFGELCALMICVYTIFFSPLPIWTLALSFGYSVLFAYALHKKEIKRLKR